MSYTRRRHIILLALLNTLLLAGVWSCRKDVDEFRTYPVTLANLDPLLGQVPNSSTKTTIPLGGLAKDTIVVTADGLRIFLTDPEQLLVDANDNPVPFSTCQNLFMEVTEVLDKGDMIARNIPSTVANGAVLESDAMLRIRFTCDGTPLKLKAGRNIKIQIPEANRQDNLFVYNGTMQNDSLSAWTATMVPVYLADWISNVTNETVLGYEIIATQLDWVACSHPLGGQASSFCVNLPDGFSNVNTVVYMVFKNVKAVVPLTGNRSQFCYAQAPQGYFVKLVTVGKFGEQYWLGNKETEIGTNTVLDVAPQIVSEQQMLNFLKGL
ncbi:MAG: hypothetical protein WCR52_03000 [Bacteroidota bacterium]